MLWKHLVAVCVIYIYSICSHKSYSDIDRIYSYYVMDLLYLSSEFSFSCVEHASVTLSVGPWRLYSSRNMHFIGYARMLCFHTFLIYPFKWMSGLCTFYHVNIARHQVPDLLDLACFSNVPLLFYHSFYRSKRARHQVPEASFLTSFATKCQRLDSLSPCPFFEIQQLA